MDRESIHIDVLKLGSDNNKKSWLVQNLPKLEGTGIVYCLTIMDCMELMGNY